MNKKEETIDISEKKVSLLTEWSQWKSLSKALRIEDLQSQEVHLF